MCSKVARGLVERLNFQSSPYEGFGSVLGVKSMPQIDRTNSVMYLNIGVSRLRASQDQTYEEFLTLARSVRKTDVIEYHAR